MPDPRRRTLTRADLPDDLTPDSLRRLPVGLLRRFADHRNGVLTEAEQAQFDASLSELMAQMASRVSRRADGEDWRRVRGQLGRPGRGAKPADTARDQTLQRIVRRLDQQVDVAEALAPGVDWSFVQPHRPAGGAMEVPTAPAPAELDAADEEQSVSDLEAKLTDQVELVQVMSDIADVSRRTLDLEQQRELANTRGVFFGLVVSVAVIVAGWAPVVMASPSQRWWIGVLTLATCLVAGLVYVLIMRRQRRQATHDAGDTVGA